MPELTFKEWFFKVQWPETQYGMTQEEAWKIVNTDYLDLYKSIYEAWKLKYNQKVERRILN